MLKPCSDVGFIASLAELSIGSQMTIPLHYRSPEDPWRVLAIDDTMAIHKDYRKVLQSNQRNGSGLRKAEAELFGEASIGETSVEYCYEIDSAYQGAEGLDMVRKAVVEGNPYTAAFVDVRMPPGWDGIETVRRIWQVAPNLPIVLCTAYTDYSWEVISRKLPRTDQLLILKKPFDPLELRQIAAAQVTRWHMACMATQNRQILETTIQNRTKEIVSTRNLVFTSLAKLAESRDPETGEHLERIEYYTQLILERLSACGPYQRFVDKQFIENVSRSSILHDIGKVGIPDHVLLKPGRLSAEEFEIMKRHTVIGADALDDAVSNSKYCGFLSSAAEIARYHHERFNGKGYPEGISGQDIPLSARVVAVADVFDALTSERVYKSAMCPIEARDMITSESGEHFDPVLVGAFLDCWDQFHERALENQANSRKSKEAVQAIESKSAEVAESV